MKKLVSSFILVLISFFILIGASYAFFDISKDYGSSPVEVESKTLSIEYSDDNIINLDGALPGAIILKQFRVTNNGSVSLTYDVILDQVINQFSRNEDLVYVISRVNGNTNNVENIFPQTNQSVADDVVIGPGVTHEYLLTVFYKNLDLDQSIDMNKLVSAVVKIDNIRENGSISLNANGVVLNSDYTDCTDIDCALNELFTLYN